MDSQYVWSSSLAVDDQDSPPPYFGGFTNIIYGTSVTFDLHYYIIFSPVNNSWDMVGSTNDIASENWLSANNDTVITNNWSPDTVMFQLVTNISSITYTTNYP